MSGEENLDIIVRMLRAIFVAAAAWGLAAASVSSAGALPVWLPVVHTTKARGKSYPETVKTEADQANVAVDRAAPAGVVFGGEPGATNLRTRHLRFTCRGTTYEVPDEFVEDLLWLGADSSVRASLSTHDVVFTMIGSSGAHNYLAHFDFRHERFFQRVLDYSEARTILIRTAADATPSLAH